MTLIIVMAVMLAGTIVILATTAAFMLHLAGNIMTGVPFVPAPRRAVEELAALCPLTSSSVFYDLGCGDGRVVYAMARRYPEACCIGVEKAPLPSFFSWIRARVAPLPNARVRYEDFSTVDLRGATHVFVYLFPALMERLLPKLEAELRSGTRVVSCDFTFKNRAPDKVLPLGLDKHPHRLYVYRF